MTHLKRSMESMIFDYETTSRTDYTKPKIQVVEKSLRKNPKTCAMVRPPPLKDLHTLTDWKTPVVPFDAFGSYERPKEIVHTNPRDIQKTVRREDLEQKERVKGPRLVMTPALCFEDIDDERIKKRILDDFYTTTLMRANKDAAHNIRPAVQAPLPERPAPANPITLRKVQPPYVPPEWRMESMMWDQNQLRAYSDPTKAFWMKGTPK